MKNKTLKDITYSALLIALIIIGQLISKSLGQYVTGSCVNLILATSAFLFNNRITIPVALISPFMAFVLSIGTPIIQLVPFIAIGNLVYVLIINKLKKSNILAIVFASFVKFTTLYLLITKVALPMLKLPQAKVDILSLSFSYPQLVTASIGGILALIISKQLSKYFNN